VGARILGFARLTFGYSKKFKHLIHSINLMMAHYNFFDSTEYTAKPAEAAWH
jgi:hypothetical protein